MADEKIEEKTEEKIVVGSEEWCSLPELDIKFIKARVDSGAKTSALHATGIKLFKKDGKNLISFQINPIQGNRKITKKCLAEVIDTREVKSSNGYIEKRYVIRTMLILGVHHWEIELTLTNRDSMGYRMLLGRQAMREKILVDPARAFCSSEVSDEEIEKHYTKLRSKPRKLKLILLGSDPELYSNKRIIEAALAAGHEMRFVNIKHCYFGLTSAKAYLYHKDGEILENIDAVIPRIRPSMTFYGCSLLKQFELLDIFCLNNAEAILLSRNKLHSLQKLASKAIDIPATGFSYLASNSNNLIKLVGGAPLIVKLLEGTQGKGVVISETNKSAESVIGAFKTLDTNLLIQEYIKESQGRDLRCFVIDNKVVGAMERRAALDEFRANLHQGGEAFPVEITAKEKRLAIAAAKAMGLAIAGVDILRSNNGPKVIEINSSPGLEGIERITKKDIAGLMIEAVEKFLL